jgi:putative flippase GtrA
MGRDFGPKSKLLCARSLPHVHFYLLPAPLPRKHMRMKDLSDIEPPKRRQKVRARFFWFLAGAVVNYLLILTPFKWLRLHHPDWPLLAISACSIGVSASFFFVWNYFINFRGDSRKRDALPRYIGAVILMSGLSTCLLTFLKHHNAHMAFSVGKIALDLDIVATQFFLSGLKFFLYHKWVFPLPKETPTVSGETLPPSL